MYRVVDHELTVGANVLFGLISPAAAAAGGCFASVKSLMSEYQLKLELLTFISLSSIHYHSIHLFYILEFH